MNAGMSVPPADQCKGAVRVTHAHGYAKKFCLGSTTRFSHPGRALTGPNRLRGVHGAKPVSLPTLERGRKRGKVS